MGNSINSINSVNLRSGSSTAPTDQITWVLSGQALDVLGYPSASQYKQSTSVLSTAVLSPDGRHRSQASHETEPKTARTLARGPLLAVYLPTNDDWAS